MTLPNGAHAVFKLVNMLTGPVYNGPNKEIQGTKCWPFTGALNSEGRPYISIGGKKMLAYRVVFELVTGIELSSRTMIRHKCDNGSCCNPKHHETGGQVENMKDMRDRERHGLPHHTVRAIRKLHAMGGNTHQEIADLYGLGRSTVTEILSGLKYRDVKDDPDGT